MSIQERYTEIMGRIEEACKKAGRSPDDVNLLAVSKTHGPEKVEEAAACGIKCFGENRVQEAQAKISRSPNQISWHLIGHLQRNKARQAAMLFDMIHSVDSERIMDALNMASDACGKIMPICLEVNVSGESAKFGLKPEEVPAIIEHSNKMMNLEVRGLMTMPPFAPDPEKARAYFAQLRELRDQWETETGVPLPELSMGMSMDFEVAIEEGSTWVRVGSDIFGARGKPWKALEE